MDKFVRRIEKNCEPIHSFGTHGFLDLVDRNVPILVKGCTGCGKTAFVRSTLKDRETIWIDTDEVRTKSGATKVLERYHDTNKIIVFDDIDEVVYPFTFGMKHLQEHGYKVGNMATIYIGTNDVSKMSEVDEFPCPPLDRDTLEQIGDIRLWSSCQGDVRKYIQRSRGQSDKADVFFPPKTIAESILKGDCVVPLKQILSDVGQHGSVWGIIHQNFWQTEHQGDFYDCMSSADVLDTKIYNGDWSLFPYFLNEAIAMPSVMVRRGTESNSPGSAWSKHNNMTLRQTKLRKIMHRTRIPIESLKFVIFHFDVGQLHRYGFIPSDLELLNAISAKKITKRRVDAMRRQLKKLIQQTQT